MLGRSSLGRTGCCTPGSSPFAGALQTPKEVWEDKGLYKTAGKHIWFALMAAVPETRVLHQGSTGHSTGAVLSSLAPFPHSSARSLPWAWLPVPCPFPEQRQPQNGAKRCQAAPPILPSLVPCHLLLMEGHHKQSSESPHGDIVLCRGGSATLQAGPCPSSADVQAWHPLVMLQPSQCFLPLLPGHRDIALGPRQATDTELWEGTLPTDSTEDK